MMTTIPEHKNICKWSSRYFDRALEEEHIVYPYAYFDKYGEWPLPRKGVILTPELPALLKDRLEIPDEEWDKIKVGVQFKGESFAVIMPIRHYQKLTPMQHCKVIPPAWVYESPFDKHWFRELGGL